MRKISLKLEDDAVAFLGERGYDPAFGARPVKRVVQQLLETSIAKVLSPPSPSLHSTVSRHI